MVIYLNTTVIIYVCYAIVEKDWLNTFCANIKKRKDRMKKKEECRNCKIVNSKKTVTSGTRHVCISSLWFVIMQKALELRKKSFLSLKVWSEDGARRRKKEKEKKNHWHCFASIRLHRVITVNFFPGSLGTVVRPFNVSIFRVWTRRGRAWSFLRRVHVVLWDTSVKQSRLLSRFKPRVEIRAS